MRINVDRQMTRIVPLVALACISRLSAADVMANTISTELTQIDRYTLAGEKHLVRDFAPVDDAGNLHAVVEIPTGTNGKWEVEKDTGHLAWELKKGKPRVVSYLGYPGNYGMIPRTLLPESMGGDGDPLDVLILGPAVPRGTIVKARLIGVLKMLDDGEQDDKLLAVIPGSALGHVMSVDQLDSEFRGVTEIVELWFTNYKGPGRIKSLGFADATEARQVLDASVMAFKQHDEQ